MDGGKSCLLSKNTAISGLMIVRFWDITDLI
jgi:hypothetical protein